MNKNNSGFSLVELIVVIAIMAILAGIAVPTYTKYIAQTNDAAVLSELDAVKTAAIAAGAKESVSITSISIKVADKSVKTNSATIDATDINAFLDTEISSLDFSKTSYKDSTYVKWTSTSQKWESSETE